jgi:predicted DNA-binding WGR domain protein
LFAIFQAFRQAAPASLYSLHHRHVAYLHQFLLKVNFYMLPRRLGGCPMCRQDAILVSGEARFRLQCSAWAAMMTVDIECRTVRRWQSATRYYTAEVVRDLFGEWAVLRSWGGMGSRRGAYHFTHAPTYQAALDALEALDQRRVARGYQRVCVAIL